MMKNKSLFAIVTLLVILGSCKMQNLMVDVYTPAKMDLPPEVRNFVVVSRFIPATGDYDDIKWGYYQSVDSLVLEASEACLNGFSEEFSSFGRYAVTNPKKYRMFHHNGDSLPEALPWKGLVAICKNEHADAIALLEGFSIRQEKVEVKTFSDNDTSGFIAEQKAIAKVAWRIEQPKRHRMLDENVYTCSKIFTGKGKTGDEALANLPDKKMQLLETAKYAGADFARQMKPGFIEVKRDFYCKGDSILEQTAPYVKSGDWGKVEYKWKKNAYKGETDELKAMCSFNMALLSEKQGFLNQALGFARRAQRLMPSKKHLKYINELTIRQMKQEDMIKNGQIKRNW